MVLLPDQPVLLAVEAERGVEVIEVLVAERAARGAGLARTGVLVEVLVVFALLEALLSNHLKVTSTTATFGFTTSILPTIKTTIGTLKAEVNVKVIVLVRVALPLAFVMV